MGRYDADKPHTWLTCLTDPVAGCVTTEQLKQVFAEDERIVTTLDRDTFVTREDALLEIYRKLRPGDPPTVESAESLIDSLFFDKRRYDLFSVGRYKFNKKLGLAGRLMGHQLIMPLADPATGEIVAEEGEVVSFERAQYLESCGITEALGSRPMMARKCVYSPTAWSICPTSWTSIPPRSASPRRCAISSFVSSWSSTKARPSRTPSARTSIC